MPSRLLSELPVHFEPVAFLAIWLEGGSKREAIEGAFDGRHAARGQFGTGLLWQGEKDP